MKIRELKTLINNYSEEFDEFDVVFRDYPEVFPRDSELFIGISSEEDKVLRFLDLYGARMEMELYFMRNEKPEEDKS